MKFPILYVQLAWLTAAATASPQEGRGDASDNGASCKAFKHWDCADPPRVDEVELLDLGDLSLEDAPARRLRLRDVDFSDVDEKTGFNVTELIRRESAIETDDKTLHSKILRLLSDPEVVGDKSEVANLYYKRQTDDEDSGDDSDNDNKFDANKPDKVFADNSAGPGSSHTYDMCTPKISYKVQGYEGTTDLYDLENWGDCKNFNIVYKKNTINNRNGLRTYIREHILEKQMLQIFINQKFKNQKGSPVPSYDANSIKSHCHYLQRFWEGKGKLSQVGDQKDKAWDAVARAWPHRENKDHSSDVNDIVWLEAELNGYKERAFDSSKSLRSDKKMKSSLQDIHDAKHAATALRMTILVGKYMDNDGISAIYKAQAQRVAVKLNEVEDALVVNWQGSETEYERLDLSGKWLQFMKEWTDRTNKKLEDFLLKYLPRAKELIKEADEKAAELKKEKKELPKDDKDLLDTLRATVEEIERTTGPNKPKALFKNPFEKDRQTRGRPRIHKLVP
ncbi:hypothetical protein VdG1_04555 [Verticillium dahliae VDG1]|nr:hypothetical protein VdG1_04555 [Verticillium dahliae VDG1]